jgi:CheY-like chemotaxis protein
VGEGCRVSEAQNGRIALERLGADAPDLILLDLMMPEMDGFAFLAAFRQLPGHEKIPVIVVTAADLSDEDRRRLNSGVVDVLLKDPDAEEELLMELGNLIRSYHFDTRAK